MNTDMRKFEASQKDESRAQSTDSSKAYIENLLELLLVHCSRVSYFFRLVRIERNKTAACKDVKFKNQNRRQNVLNRGFKFAQGS